MQKTTIAVVTLMGIIASVALLGCAYAETHVIRGDNFPLMLDVKNTDT